MKLVIGSKNWSSWSLRPWLGLRVAGIDFDEVLIPLRRGENTRQQIHLYSPTGKVPALIDGDLAVWDSLAIAEYIAESNPELWPADPRARAIARSICAEMHSGFAALRAQCPQDVRSRISVAMSPELQADIERVQQLWADCRRRFGHEGPWLFGRFCWADAFFAPVVLRFVTYWIEVSPQAEAYMQTVLRLPQLQEWIAAAEAECPPD